MKSKLAKLYLLATNVLVVVSFNYAIANGNQTCKTAVGESSIKLDWVQRMARRRLPLRQQVINDAVQAGTTAAITKNQKVVANHDTHYTKKVTRGVITDQKRSGNCWIFAGTNMLRAQMLKDKSVFSGFDFSQAYLYFFSQLEGANNHLEHIIGLSKKKRLSEKKLRKELRPFVVDGGFYSDFIYLVQKYGLIPKSAMPDTANIENTALLRKHLNDYLLQMSDKLWSRVEELRGNENHVARHTEKQAQDIKLPVNIRLLTDQEVVELRQLKNDILEGVWKILETHLGKPPTTFTFKMPKSSEGTNKVKIHKFTPQEFAQDVANFKVDDFVVITNLANRSQNQLYLKSGVLGDYKNSRPMKFLNLTADRMRELTVNTIDSDIPVYFIGDFGKGIDGTTGIMHPSLKVTNGIYNFSRSQRPPVFSKEQEFYYRMTYGSHAVAIDGYDRPSHIRSPIKYRVQNSWGKKSGDKGTYHMYREWFDQYVYFIVVPKSELSEAEVSLWEGRAKKIRDDESYY